MALLWPKHGPHMILQIGSSRILINVPEGYSMPNFTLLGVSCSCCFNKWPIYGPFLLENGPFIAKSQSSHGPSNWFFLNHNHCAQG